MRTISSIQEMQKMALATKRNGKTIGFVPTMGFLHEGHLSLLRLAKGQSDVVVMSIFVNPLQFGPKEDLAAYPRDLEGDSQKAQAGGADLLFLPSADEMYSDSFQTHVDVEKLSLGLCGEFRPGHFRGVATVVAKLFNIVLPDFAFFGRKDFQQLQVIRRMVEDLHFPIQIVEGETVREADGLAMSSRNAKLSPEARKEAAVIPRALESARLKTRSRVNPASAIRKDCLNQLEKISGLTVEYLDLVHPVTLQPVELVGPGHPAMLACAVRVGGVRLIDNVLLSETVRE